MDMLSPSGMVLQQPPEWEACPLFQGSKRASAGRASFLRNCGHLQVRCSAQPGLTSGAPKTGAELRHRFTGSTPGVPEARLSMTATAGTTDAFASASYFGPT